MKIENKLGLTSSADFACEKERPSAFTADDGEPT